MYRVTIFEPPDRTAYLQPLVCKSVLPILITNFNRIKNSRIEIYRFQKFQKSKLSKRFFESLLQIELTKKKKKKMRRKKFVKFVVKGVSKFIYLKLVRGGRSGWSGSVGERAETGVCARSLYNRNLTVGPHCRSSWTASSWLMGDNGAPSTATILSPGRIRPSLNAGSRTNALT